ncbi:DNA topoisomerase I [Candidatus Woesebacteria bacterium RIFOXYB1_FULL_40_26]|uniref:DNA topoisomerase 1 n=1 Tax=Candidatus Woesebacteria bacterium RIFOXYB1_FULL_40_26 TaxID=1802539 RepID=A0A1F8CZ39_9BACT|nr:MAG: DNA topoisomerase I [Candidatus Woesebacteria bacterium RIFOXYB1_FULL_40_26]
MNLIIVESPTKARTLSKFLGSDYSVEATMGHVKDLPKSELGIDLKKDFKPDYVPVPGKEEVIALLQKLAKKAKQVFLATDPDREGEAISYHVKEVLNTDGKVKRITFHEITKEAVEEAIAAPRAIDKNLVDAQVGRRVLDRLVGYKLSPLLWRKVRRGLSAGRVQTVTVRLIVEREREIEKFKSDEYWEIYALLKNSKTQKLQVQLIKVDDKKAEVKDKKTADKILADLKKAKYKVKLVDKHEVRKNPYAPFTTSTMSQAGARLFFWSAKKTMRTAQKLYEEGLITYHRTDSTNIAVSAVNKVRDYIKKEYGEKYLPESPRIYKTQSKVAQEAHEAIRPTNVSNSKLKIQNSKFFQDQEKLYDLIWRRFVASQMTPSVYDETTIDVEARGRHPERAGRAEGSNIYLLRASGQSIKFDGWKKVIPPAKDTQEISQKLPEVSQNEALRLIKVDGTQKFTEPPPRYNEASLIKTLEKLGIGRPSTYAPTISTIQIRQYVEKNEGKFFPTPVGVAVNDFLLKYFPDVFGYQFTAEMEADLDNIANGKTDWESPIKKFWSPFAKTLEIVQKGSKRVKIEVEKLDKKCPKCKEGELVIRIGRFGKFISCSRFPDCDYTEKYVEKIGMKCPKCKEGDVVIKKSGKGRNFFGCSRYPDCKWASWRNPKQPA